MKPVDAVFMICLGVAIGGAAVYLSTPKSAAAVAKENVHLGEVTDLINRLRPFAIEPESDWRGVVVRVTGHSAKVEFRSREGNDISAAGPTLKDAVSVLQDSAKLKGALEGWGERR